jgi:hypothetical protein
MMRVLCYIKPMESWKTNPIEKGASPREQVFAKFFSKHVAAALISLISFQAAEKPAEAQQVKPTKIEQGNPAAIEKDRRKALEDFKALVDKNKIDEIFSAQEERFGFAVVALSINREVGTDLGNMQDLYKRKEDKDLFVSPEGPQFTTLGSVVASAYKDRWLPHKQVARPMQFENMEAIPGLNAKGVEEMLNVIYPKNYLAKCVSKIQFVNQTDVREDQQAEILGYVQSFGLSNLGKDADLRSVIKINLTTRGITRETFLDTLVHEAGHTFDPINNSILTSTERVLMLEDIYQRSIAPDRYMSRYVEGITIEKLGIYFKDSKTIDPKQYLAFIKATEYWAEIHRAYFDGPEQFKKTNPKDYAVVKKWIDATMK